MPCIAALIVLGILSLFSAKYRGLAKEALDCVFRRVTLRPCNTGFDVKVKSTILSKLLDKSPTLARFVSRQFETISMLFVLSFFVSLIWTGRGMYLFWTTGNCNGLNQGGFCAFDPTGKNNAVSGTSETCNTGGSATGNLTLQNVNLDSFYTLKGETDKELVFIGCYSCKYTHATYPMIKDLIKQYKPTVRYVFYPAHREADYLMPYDYCIQNTNPDKYLSWIDALYSESLDTVASESSTIQIIKSLGIDDNTITQCISEPDTKQIVQKRIYEIDKTGIYGTPTIFLNGTPVVGPKPYRVYRRLLNNSWF